MVGSLNLDGGFLDHCKGVLSGQIIQLRPRGFRNLWKGFLFGRKSRILRFYNAPVNRHEKNAY